MPFVVKATGPGLGGTWLGVAPAGFHTFGPRQSAMVFEAQADAQAEAEEVSRAFGYLGILFSVESAEA
jgi:hypothetical protein